MQARQLLPHITAGGGHKTCCAAGGKLSEVAAERGLSVAAACLRSCSRFSTASAERVATWAAAHATAASTTPENWRACSAISSHKA